MLIPSVRSDSGLDLLTIKSTISDTGATFAIHVSGTQRRAPDPVAVMTLADVDALISVTANTRRGAGREVIDHVWHELDRRNAAVYAADLARVAAAYSADIRGLRLEDLQAQVTELQVMRTQYAEYILAIALEDSSETSSSRMPFSVITALDGLASSMLINQIDLLNQLSRDAQAEAKIQQGLDTRREHRLVAWATVLILPSLWFAFLGANVFPASLLGLAVASELSTLIALGGAGGLAILGFLILILVVRVRSGNKKERGNAE